MFTGIIQHTGRLDARSGDALRIEAPAELMAGVKPGDSVAVNGVCLTAVRLTETSFEADLLPATLAQTTFGELPVGAPVNLETALRVGDTLGGHIVQGHVDGMTVFQRADGAIYSFESPAWLRPWLVPKGSICLDGVSLTVQELEADSFSVQLIPETLRHTSLGALRLGQKVNLEADLIVKTVSQMVEEHLKRLAGNQDKN